MDAIHYFRHPKPKIINNSPALALIGVALMPCDMRNTAPSLQMPRRLFCSGHHQSVLDPWGPERLANKDGVSSPQR